MHAENLIKMANDIGAFFEAMPNREQATKDVATHIQKFWEPRMQKALVTYLKAHGDAVLKEIVRDAVRQIHPWDGIGVPKGEPVSPSADSPSG